MYNLEEARKAVVAKCVRAVKDCLDEYDSIRAQAGCPYCDDRPTALLNHASIMSRVNKVDDTYLIHVKMPHQGYDEETGYRINYCPKCGRKLGGNK